MQPMEQMMELDKTEQSRVDTVVETLATLGMRGQHTAEIAHDARNMFTALDLYCDLLQEPGVLAPPFAHYGGELRLVAAASRRLVHRLISLDMVPEKKWPDNRTASHSAQGQHWQNVPAEPIANLAEELLANRNLLAALAGPTVALTVDVEAGAVPVHMTGEDLTRILVNLVKNAAEAMAAVGRIHITLRESCGEPANSPWVTMNIEDNGPGLPGNVLDKIFNPHPPADLPKTGDPASSWPVRRHGLGLSIVRSIVETAGGSIHAANRDPVGACFQIELPARLR